MAGIARDWKWCLRLYRSPHIQHHPEWLTLDAQLEGGSNNILVVALYEGKYLVGVAPFSIRPWHWEYRVGRKTLIRLPMRRAYLYGHTFLGPEDPEAQEAILEAVATAPLPYHAIFAESLPIESTLWRLLHESPVVGKHFWVDTSAGIKSLKKIHLRGSFEEYLGQFSTHSRRILRQAIRKMEEACGGELRVERVTRRDQVAALLKKVEQVSERSWQGTRLGKVIRATEDQQKLLEARADLGRLRAYVLHDDQIPIAFALDYQADGVYYCSQWGYDPRWAKYSPGKVLFYRILEDLFTVDKPEWVDFGDGDREHKHFWANVSESVVNTYMIRKSAYTHLARATCGVCSGIVRSVRSTLKALGLQEMVRQLICD